MKYSVYLVNPYGEKRELARFANIWHAAGFAKDMSLTISFIARTEVIDIDLSDVILQFTNGSEVIE
jgi:hypothetical protein